MAQNEVARHFGVRNTISSLWRRFQQNANTEICLGPYVYLARQPYWLTHLRITDFWLLGAFLRPRTVHIISPRRPEVPLVTDRHVLPHIYGTQDYGVLFTEVEFIWRLRWRARVYIRPLRFQRQAVAAALYGITSWADTTCPMAIWQVWDTGTRFGPHVQAFIQRQLSSTSKFQCIVWQFHGQQNSGTSAVFDLSIEHALKWKTFSQEFSHWR